jgi:hypothetical protein
LAEALAAVARGNRPAVIGVGPEESVKGEIAERRPKKRSSLGQGGAQPWGKPVEMEIGGGAENPGAVEVPAAMEPRTRRPPGIQGRRASEDTPAAGESSTCRPPMPLRVCANVSSPRNGEGDGMREIQKGDYSRKNTLPRERTKFGQSGVTDQNTHPAKAHPRKRKKIKESRKHTTTKSYGAPKSHTKKASEKQTIKWSTCQHKVNS